LWKEKPADNKDVYKTLWKRFRQERGELWIMAMNLPG